MRTHTAARRVLVYSHDTYGLGNIRRTLAIAEHLAANQPDVTVLIVSGSPMLHAFRISQRLDYIKLPCLSRDATGEYHVKTLDVAYATALDMRIEILNATMRSFRPDVVVVDKKPFGVDEELRPAIETAASLPDRPRMVLVLRDILDSPERTRTIWSKNGYYDAVEQFYDSVLVLGSREVFDLPDEYGFPPGAAEKVHFCGYVHGASPTTSDAPTSPRRGTSKVLVTVGGGHDGFRLASTHLDCVEQSDVAWSSTLVAGPEMSDEERAHLRARVQHLPSVEMLDFSDDIPGLMIRADLVVCMGGYNTTAEVLRSGRPAVVVPRVAPVAEQAIRAARLHSLGALRMIHPDDLDAGTLQSAISAELESPARREPALIDLGGCDRVEKHLSVLLGQR